ncbi:MAG: dihydrofolate reductase [Chlorobi bacterium]|nr:dihydrofolate reductase [Chlorobiota bacterium]
MIISLIVAYDSQRGIGRNGQLPWRIPADLRVFKQLTWGHHIIMGRRTCQSIGRALPGRTNLVVTRSDQDLPHGCTALPSLDQALEYARMRGETECFVIGGAMLYRTALDYADRIYASEIDGTFECDTFFPSISPTEWTERLIVPFPSIDPSVPHFRVRVLDRVGRHLPPPHTIESADQR